MNGQVYIIGGKQWKVIDTFQRRNVDWARLQRVDRRGQYKSTTLAFLSMIEKHQRIS